MKTHGIRGKIEPLMTPPDFCPKCRGELAGPSDPCPQCGFQTPAEPESQPVESEPAVESQPAKESAGFTGLIEMDYAVSGDDMKPELPQWRVELSRRFQEIKSRREGGTAPALEQIADSAPEPASHKEIAALPKEAAAALPPRPRRPRTARPEIRINQAQEVAPMPLFEAPAPGTPTPVPKRVPSDTIQEMIDRAVAKQAPAPFPVPPAATPVFTEPERLPLESRLILLSRTLSGLVDLIIVVFCAVAFVIAADRISGIETLDSRSLLHYGALLLATFFLYSVFFLFTGNQTIGMMITDLCVVDVGDVRPKMARIAGRSALYLVSLLGAGIGLLWGCFDAEARCLHDRYSGTRIVRLTR